MILTTRLDLVAATTVMVRAALEGPRLLETRLGATVPPSWPPMYLDVAALEFTLARLEEAPDQAEWWLHFAVLRGDGPARTLIGTCGYTGPPSTDGTVEVGYSIVEDHQRNGYATEAVRGMVSHAFALPGIQRVIADTLPELEASIGVVLKCGFRPAGQGSGPGVIRFELTRGMYGSGIG